MQEIQGIQELSSALGELRRRSRALSREALFVCAQHCKAVAVAYAPRSPLSPTIPPPSSANAAPHPAAFWQPRKSIECEADDTRAAVFVRQNAYCVSSKGYNYAKRIHDERGISWHNLGAGSIAKGGKVGEKFILRAIQDSVDWCRRAIQGRLAKL